MIFQFFSSCLSDFSNFEEKMPRNCRVKKCREIGKMPRKNIVSKNAASMLSQQIFSVKNCKFQSIFFNFLPQSSRVGGCIDIFWQSSMLLCGYFKMAGVGMSKQNLQNSHKVGLRVRYRKVAHPPVLKKKIEN